MALTCFAEVGKSSAGADKSKMVVGEAGLVFLQALQQNLFVSVKIIRATSEDCGKEMFKRMSVAAVFCVDHLLREMESNKHWQVRRKFVAWLAVVAQETYSQSLSSWGKQRMDQVEEVLGKAEKDKKSEVRTEASKALKEIRLLRTAKAVAALEKQAL